MKKIKLYAIGNENKLNYYIIDKKQKSIENIARLFSEIFKLYLDFHKEYEDTNGVWRSRKINLEKIKDKHKSISNYSNNNRIDIFFGEKRAFITISCSQTLRKKFNEELIKISKMPKTRKS